MASVITDLISSSQRMVTGIATKIGADPLKYVMMGVPPNKRISAAIYVVGSAVIYGFVMRIFFRAEDMLSAEDLAAEEPLASDDILAMLGEMVGTGVDAITNTADALSEALGVKPKATDAARQAQAQAKKVARAAAAVRRTAWYHHFLRGLVLGLLLWNALAILSSPPSDDLLATYGFPEPKLGNTSYRSSRFAPPDYTRDREYSATSYTPYYRAASASPSSAAYRSSGATWTPVSRCGR